MTEIITGSEILEYIQSKIYYLKSDGRDDIYILISEHGQKILQDWFRDISPGINCDAGISELLGYQVYLIKELKKTYVVVDADWVD